MTNDVLDRLRRHASSPAVVGLLLFGYGAVAVGFVLRVGGASGLLLVLALQVTSVPVLFASTWATVSGRPRLVPAFAIAPAAGVATRIGASVVPVAGVNEALQVALVVVPTLAGFAVSWAVLGYVGGTAVRWGRRRDRIARLELVRSCSLVLAGSAFACVCYGVSWSYYVVGLGDAVV